MAAEMKRLGERVKELEAEAASAAKSASKSQVCVAAVGAGVCSAVVFQR